MNASPTLTPAELAPVIKRLSAANQDFLKRYPGESNRRQPVHVVYGGAHLFKADTARRLGSIARHTLAQYAPDGPSLAKALGAAWPAAFAAGLHTRITAKLDREPVEDFRLDFEDGYGSRPDAEEDGHAVSSAQEVAAGLAAGTLPPFLGIRIKPFNEDTRTRSLRTMDLFLTTLLGLTDKRLPDQFVITLPKVQLAAHVAAAESVCDLFEANLRLPPGLLRLELMVETPQSILGHDGVCPLQSFIAAAQGRCSSVHFGVYDYTASYGITAAWQAMGHPACDFARTVMTTALAGTGVHLSDGATNILPVGPHRGDSLTGEQQQENREAVHSAWKMAFEDNLHSLQQGLYEGWDLHPAQFIPRYAAVYSFFLSALPAATGRLKTFVEKAAQASLFGEVFDDAATGQGLLNFFLRGIACGAITESEALATGLTLEEIRTRSFQKILEGRRG
jgi:citrate lyase beta subunit